MNATAPAKPASMKLFIYLGLGIFVFILGIALTLHYIRLSHTWNWTPAEAEVLQTVDMCDVEYKRSGKRQSWKRDSTLPCEEAEAYAAQKRQASSAGSWRVNRVPHLRIAFANGSGQSDIVVRSSKVSSNGAQTGDKLPIFFNPQNPADVDRPIASRDYQNLAFMAALGAAIGLAIAILGVVVTRLNQRYAARKALAAEASNAAGSDAVSYPATSGEKKGSGVLGWVGLVIFIVAGLFALLAVLGGSAAERQSVNLGAAIIAGFGLVIWLVLSFIGRRMAR